MLGGGVAGIGSLLGGGAGAGLGFTLGEMATIPKIQSQLIKEISAGGKYIPQAFKSYLQNQAKPLEMLSAGLEQT